MCEVNTSENVECLFNGAIARETRPIKLGNRCISLSCQAIPSEATLANKFDLAGVLFDIFSFAKFDVRFLGVKLPVFPLQTEVTLTAVLATVKCKMLPYNFFAYWKVNDG